MVSYSRQGAGRDARPLGLASSMVPSGEGVERSGLGMGLAFCLATLDVGVGRDDRPMGLARHLVPSDIGVPGDG
jgi:hypothetical protein